MPLAMVNSGVGQDTDTDAAIHKVEAYLQDLLKQKTVKAAAIGSPYADLLRQVSRLMKRGGKRLRPRLVLKAYAAYGGTDQSAIIRIAASQELFHCFILMHDDIIDRDTTRWGGPNISGHYMQDFSTQTNPFNARHYADSLALLSGDLCLSLSHHLLISSGFRPSQIIKAQRMLADTLFSMIGGETLDTLMPLLQPASDIPDEDILRLYEAKTSIYSFCMPLKIGGLLAGASASQLKKLDAIGRFLGISFQIRDDLQGIFGETKTTGKSNLSDIRQGKHTLLMNHAWRQADSKQKYQLERIVGNSTAGQGELQTVRAILRETGAVHHVNAVLQAHCQEAHHLLISADLPASLCEYLIEMAATCASQASSRF